MVETPSELEKQIAVARRAVTGTYLDARSRVQEVVSRWIGIEQAVECAFDIVVVLPYVLTRIERWLTGDLICQGSRHTLSSGPKTVSCVWRTCAVSSTAATSTRSPASAELRTVGRLLSAR